MIKIILLILFFVFTNNAYSALKEIDLELSTDTRFEGIVIPSLVNAYADFLTFDYKITNFTVSIKISENIIITFIPKFAPEEGTPLGGKTKYGRVISYETDIKTGDIISRSFAR